jgi:hypothetical protein
MNQPRESIDAHVLAHAGLLDPVAEPGILTAVFGGLRVLVGLGGVRRSQLSASVV